MSGFDEISPVQYGTLYDGSPSRHLYLKTPLNTVEALKGIGNHIMGLGKLLWYLGIHMYLSINVNWRISNENFSLCFVTDGGFVTRVGSGMVVIFVSTSAWWLYSMPSSDPARKLKSSGGLCNANYSSLLFFAQVALQTFYIIVALACFSVNCWISSCKRP